MKLIDGWWLDLLVQEKTSQANFKQEGGGVLSVAHTVSMAASTLFTN